MQYKSIVRAIAVALGVGITTTAFADHPRVSPDLGTPVHADVFDRQIDIGPRTESTSVRREETVKFVVMKPDGSRGSFVWQFDTRGRPPVELGAIAPNDMLAGRQVTVYVRPGLYDRGP